MKFIKQPFLEKNIFPEVMKITFSSCKGVRCLLVSYEMWNGHWSDNL